MKALATAAALLSICVPVCADEPAPHEIMEPAGRVFVLDDAQMDTVVAGYWDVGVIILDEPVVSAEIKRRGDDLLIGGTTDFD